MTLRPYIAPKGSVKVFTTSNMLDRFVDIKGGGVKGYIFAIQKRQCINSTEGKPSICFSELVTSENTCGCL